MADTTLDRATSGFPIHWLVAALVIFQPLCSGLRGISVTAGQAALLGADVVLCGITVLSASRIQNPVIKWTFALGFIAIIQSFTIANFPMMGLLSGIRKSFLILFALALGASVPFERRNFVHWSIIISCAIVAAYAIKQHFLFDTFDSNLLAAQTSDKYTNLFAGHIRSFSLLSSGFHVGFICNIMIAYALFGRFVPLPVSIILFIIGGAALVFTYTRTWEVVAALMMLLRICRTFRIHVLAIVIVVPLLYLPLMIAAPDNVPNPFTTVAEDSRFAGRSVSYEDAADYWDAYPLRLLTGFGVGSAGSAQKEVFTNVPWIEPHNIFLKYIFEMGAILGIVFIALIAVLSANALRLARFVGERDLVAVLLFALVLSGLSIAVVEAWPANIFLFLIIGMYLAVPITPKRNQDGYGKQFPEGGELLPVKLSAQRLT